jgi:tripartite ATP-independent transporter DctM subunit
MTGASQGAMRPFSRALSLSRGISPLVSGLALAGLGAMVAVPLLVAAMRLVSGVDILSGGGVWVQHLTLWVGLFGAAVASFQDRHLSMSLSEAVQSPRWERRLDSMKRCGAVAVLIWATVASLRLVWSEVSNPETVGGWLPVWVAIAAMPVGFALMSVGTVWRSGANRKGKGLLVLVALLVGLGLSVLPEGGGGIVASLGLLLLVGLAAAGMPIYAVLGGAGLLLFFASQVTVVAVPAETYRVVTQPVLPSIPLFALAGVILARGGAPGRLVRLVRAWTGWLPGGAAMATVLGCAFFTAITGASGVTIVALGGLLLPILLAARHEEGFSLGLLTASGSVGLLFPPSLPVILYAVTGRVAIDRLFLAGFIPGVLLLLCLGIFSVIVGRKVSAARTAFEVREAMDATRGAWGDLLLPVMILVALFGGLMILVEIAALTALWAILLEAGIHRKLTCRNGLMEAFVEAAVLVGVLVVIIGLAQGLVSYLVDDQVPDRAAQWVSSAIQSKWLFLLLLNLGLLLVGAFMDIYTAIVVVVPLILPIAMAFGLDAAHLGVIFLANLELGYLTPPVGMNLFLSSLTFDRPLLSVWRAALPFLAIFSIWVLLVTYLPALSVGFANLFAA